MLHLDPKRQAAADVETAQEPTIRVFFSSTFTDFVAERNALLERSVPVLKQRARVHGLDFSVSTLRWGVSQHVFETHDTVEVCLREVSNIVKESAGACFLGMLGDKYGWTPAPVELSPALFHALVEHTFSPTKAILERWYKQDLNDTKQRFHLLPFSDSHSAEEWVRDGPLVSEAVAALAKSDAAATLPAEVQEEVKLAFMSVTEREFRQAQEDDPRFNSRAMLLLRSIPTLTTDDDKRRVPETDPARCRYLDAPTPSSSSSSSAHGGGGGLNAVARERLAALRREMEETITTVHAHTLPWAENRGIDEETLPEHAAYLDRVCAQFEAFATASIMAAAQRREESETAAVAAALNIPPALLSEVYQHHVATAAKATSHIGRDDIVDPIVQHACRVARPAPRGSDSSSGGGDDKDGDDASAGDLATERLPLLVHGKSGAGKTSIMAAAACRIWKALGCKEDSRDSSPATKDSPILLYRLLGTSPDSSSVRPLLQSLVDQLSAILASVQDDSTGNTSDTERNASQHQEQQQEQHQEQHQHQQQQQQQQTAFSLQDVMTRFHALLERLAAERPVVVMLDSLDQLSSVDATPHTVAALFPRPLPPRVAVLASVITDTDVFAELRRTLPPAATTIAVPSINPDLSQQIVVAHLQRSGRCLTPEQMSAVADACSKCPTPLYARLACRRVCEWRSFDDVSQLPTLPPTCEELIQRIFGDLEHAYGVDLVRAALALITCARRGLSLEELEDILSCEDTVLNAVFVKWTPPTRRLPPLLWARIHRELSDVMVMRGASGVRVLAWYHRAFVEACRTRYLLTSALRQRFHSLVADYFMGKWANCPKSYVDAQGTPAEALRYAAPQPLYFEDSGKVDASVWGPVPNARKLDELPFHLHHAARWPELVNACVGQYEWLRATCTALNVHDAIEEIEMAETNIDDVALASQLLTLRQLLLLSAHVVAQHPSELAAQLLARTTTSTLEDRPLLQRVCWDAWCDTRTAIVPATPCLDPPGGPLLRSFAGHSDRVTKAVFVGTAHPLILTASSDATARLWDPKDGSVVQTFKGYRTVADVAVNARMDVVAAAGETVLLFNFHTGEQLATFNCDNSRAARVLFARGDTKLLCLSRNGIHMYDIASGTADRKFQVTEMNASRAVHLDGCRDMVLSRDETELFVAYNDNCARVWALDTATVLCVLDHSCPVVTCALASNDAVLVTGDDRRQLHIWQRKDEATAEHMLSFRPARSSPITHIAPLPGAALRLVVATWDVNIKVFHITRDLKRFVKLGDFHAHSDWINSVTTSPDGQQLLSASDDRLVNLWNVSMALQGNAVVESSDNSDNSDSGDSSQPAAQDQQQASAKDTTGTAALQYHEREIVSIRCHAELPLFCTASRDKTAALWEVIPLTWDSAATPHAEGTTETSFADDDDDSQTITGALCHLELGRPIQPACRGRVSCVAAAASFHETGAKDERRQQQEPCEATSAPSQKEEGGCRSRVTEVRQLCTLSNRGRDWVTSVACMHQQPVVVFGTENKTLRFHRWTEFPTHADNAPFPTTAAGNSSVDDEGDTAHSLPVIDESSVYPQVETVKVANRVADVAVAANDEHVFVADDRGHLHLYAANGNHVVRFMHIDQRVSRLCVRGDIVLAGCADHDVLAMHWEPSTQMLRTLCTFTGHRAAVTGVCFLGGRRVASCSHDRTARLWDCGDMDNVVVVRGHSDAVHAIAASSTGHAFATAGRDARIIVRNFPECRKIGCFDAASHVMSLAFLNHPIPAFLYGTYGGRCGMLQLLWPDTSDASEESVRKEMELLLRPPTQQEYRKERKEKARQLCGWFHKQGEKVRSRKRRFFTRKTRVLEYYKAVDGKPKHFKGFVDLDEAIMVECQGDILLIHTPGRVWNLQEETKGMAQEWATLLQPYVKAESRA